MRQWSFSCADFTFPLLSQERSFRLIELLGIGGVDLGIFAGRSHVQPTHLADDLEGTQRAVRAALRDLTVSDVFLQTGPDPATHAANTPERSIRESNQDTFKRTVEFAQRLACQHITGLPGVLHDGIDPASDFQRAIDEASWRVDLAREAGITYSVEAHVGSITPDPATTRKLLAAVPGLTLTLDYGHFVYAGVSCDLIDPLLHDASHIHVRGGARGRLQTSVKQSAIDFADLARRLGQINYRGSVCLEYVYIDWQGCNESDNVSETILLKEQMESA